MNSKEALEILIYYLCGVENQEKYYEIIKQDLDKLDRYKQLGIDLDILFKALYNGIYVKQLGIGNTNYMKTIITKVKAPCLKLDHKTHTELVFDQKRSGGCWDTYYFKDYGKTWALTKEELKDE